MISRTNERGCNPLLQKSARVLASQVWRLWSKARVTLGRGVGVFGVGCVLVGCRAGAPAEWTMERMAMSQAWYEQSQTHRGQDANFQEGWRSGFADGRASFSQAWTERDPAQFEAFIWEKREQAQASWREGYDAGFASARSQSEKHSHHASVFGMPSPAANSFAGNQPAGNQPAGNHPTESDSNALNSINPSLAAPVVANPATIEPVPSQTWDPGATGLGSPAPSTTRPPAALSRTSPAPATTTPTTPTASAAPTQVPSAPGSTGDSANSLDAAIRRSLGNTRSPEVTYSDSLPPNTPSDNEAIIEPVVTPPANMAPVNPQPTPAPTLELPFNDDDVARRTSPITLRLTQAAVRSTAPQAGSPQMGQTVNNPYFTSPAESTVSPPVAAQPEPPAAITAPTAGLPAPTAAGQTVAFPRTAHGAFSSAGPIPTTATLPPAVQAQHTTTGVSSPKASEVDPPLPRRLPLRPRK